MAKIWVCGLGIVVACVLLVGCGGGDGDNTRLQEDLDATQAELEDLQMQLEEEQAEDAETAALNARIAALTATVETLTADDTDTDTDADADADDEEDDPATTTTTTSPATTAPTTTTPTTPSGANTLQANRLSEALLTALAGDSYDPGAPPSFTVNTDPLLVTISPPVTGTSAVGITRQGGFTSSSFSAPAGQTGRKFTRTTVGKDTIVVITDLETTRRVLDHHFDQREGANEAAKRSTARLTVAAGVPFADSTDNILDDSQIRITGHGFPSTQTTTPQTPKTPTTISGQVYPSTSSGGTTTYRVSGRFECGGVPGCEVLLTPTYTDADEDADTPHTLTGIALAVSDKDGDEAPGAVLYFRPSTASIQLDGSLGATIVDGQYMAFGYWLTEPSASSPDPTYTYQVFGHAVTSETPGAIPISASFTGTAVGVYVAQSGTATDLSKRQGEFTAAVNLTARAAGQLSGQIGSFKTTPLGGSTAPTNTDQWLVELAQAAADAVGSATIKIPGTTSAGGWRYSLVGNHANTDSLNDPSAAVGVFDTRIVDRLHLSGAFGATRQ